MNPHRRLAVLLTVAALSLGGTVSGAGQALAAPPKVPVGCEGYLAPPSSQITSMVYSREGRQVGCVITFHSAASGIRLVRVVLNKGWTHTVKDSGGTSSGTKVSVEFRHAATKDRASFLMRGGKTVIG